MPLLVYYILAFAFGCAVGSFLNVCIYRIPRAASVVSPPSACPFCGTSIRWYDNIPILSYVLLRGRCRECAVQISPRYALVEGLTGALFVLFYHELIVTGTAPVPVLVVYWGMVASLIVCSFVDLDLQIIPDEITIPGMILAPVLGFLILRLHPPLWEGLRLSPWERADSVIASVAGMAAGAGLMYAVGLFGKLLFKQEAMGLGDVKLMGFVGGILGWQSVAVIFFAAAIVGSVVGIVILLRTRQHVIPFGPYLACGTVIVMLWNREIFNVFRAVSGNL